MSKFLLFSIVVLVALLVGIYQTNGTVLDFAENQEEMAVLSENSAPAAGDSPGDSKNSTKWPQSPPGTSMEFENPLASSAVVVASAKVAIGGDAPAAPPLPPMTPPPNLSTPTTRAELAARNRGESTASDQGVKSASGSGARSLRQPATTTLGPVTIRATKEKQETFLKEFKKSVVSHSESRVVKINPPKASKPQTPSYGTIHRAPPRSPNYATSGSYRSAQQPVSSTYVQPEPKAVQKTAPKAQPAAPSSSEKWRQAQRDWTHFE